MSIEIKTRSGRVLYTSEATSVAAAVKEAVAASSNLSYSNLSYSNLRGSDLSGSNLSYSNLSYSNLRYSNLRGSNLSYSNLSYSNLSYSNLRGSNLRGSDLSGSNLSGSDTCLSITGLPSGHAILAPLPDGWRLTVGCWTGTVEGLRALIAQDYGWPEAHGDEIALRRPMLAALADMCDAWTVTKQHVLEEVQAKWAVKDESVTNA